MMRRLVLFLLIFCSLHAKAQFKPTGEACFGLAAFSPGFENAGSMGLNPAILGSIKNISAGIYSEKLFMLNEIRTGVFNIAFPVHNSGFALIGKYSGTNGFSESFLSLAYGRKLGANINAGVSFNYTKTAIKGYGSGSFLNYKASALFHLGTEFYFGMITGNQNSPEATGQLEWMPEMFTAGFAYVASTFCFFSLKIEKEKFTPVNITGGIHYAFDKKIFARLGFSSALAGYYLGTGIEWKQMEFLFIVSMHPQLGPTPGIQLLFHGKDKSNEL